MADELNPTGAAPAEGTEEPSIEEILASIRKIISDEPAPEIDAPPDPVVAEALPESILKDADEILDLTPFAAPPPEVPIVQEEEPVDLVLDDAPVVPLPPPIYTPPAPPPRAVPEDSLLSATAASAVTDAMQKLKQPEHNPLLHNTVLMGVKTLEQVVEELLRPLLSQWCDEHLPKIVERAVERELARLARQLEGR